LELNNCGSSLSSQPIKRKDSLSLWPGNKSQPERRNSKKKNSNPDIRNEVNRCMEHIKPDPTEQDQAFLL
jgi:hypothetical protein